jgi:hypothetical protein
MIGALLWAAAAAAAAGPVHPREIEEHLAPLVGDWTRAGKETTYRDRCIWYDRHAFVVCSLTDSGSGLRVEAIVGYSKDDGRYTYESYGNDGTSHVQYGFPLGANGLVFTDERKVGGKAVRLTTRMIPQADGRLHIAQDRSVAGGPWELAGEVDYLPRK